MEQPAGLTSSGPLDVAIIGGGLAGVIALTYARRAGLNALVLEAQASVGGLWRDLPAWQDIQISPADWALGDLPLTGTTQPHVLANIQAWVQHFGLADGIRLSAPVQHARWVGSAWELQTPQGPVRARHLIAATGAHNKPIVPPIQRSQPALIEHHSSTVRDPHMLAGRDVVVVGGSASALDLLELCFQQAARRVIWVYRGLHWFMPSGKPKHIAGSVRGFARLQAGGYSAAQQSAAIGSDMRARYQKFGISEIMPTHDFDVLHDQLMPGRPGMLARYADIERHAGTVVSVVGRTVSFSDGQTVEADLLLWGTGYSVDLSYFDDPELAAICNLKALAARCGSVVRYRDAPNLYFPGVGLDGIGSATWSYALLCRSIVSHIGGTALLDDAVVGHNVNHFEIVKHLASRDPASYPPGWQVQYQDLALNTPDDQPYPVP